MSSFGSRHIGAFSPADSPENAPNIIALTVYILVVNACLTASSVGNAIPGTPVGTAPFCLVFLMTQLATTIIVTMAMTTTAAITMDMIMSVGSPPPGAVLGIELDDGES
jgi:hypothetical protein